MVSQLQCFVLIGAVFTVMNTNNLMVCYGFIHSRSTTSYSTLSTPRLYNKNNNIPSSFIGTSRTRTELNFHKQQQQQKQQQVHNNQRLQKLIRTATDDDNADTTGTSSSSMTNTESSSSSSTTTTSLLRETQAEAQDALNSVGWSFPTSTTSTTTNDVSSSSSSSSSLSHSDDNEALTSDDVFVQMIDSSIQNDIGVALDDLLNPAKVVNIERDLYLYRIQLAQLTNAMEIINQVPDDSLPSSFRLLSTSDCDNGGGGVEAEKLRTLIQKKENELFIERKSIFRNWLKNVFLIQAIISFAVSYVMATNASILFGQYDWFMNPKYNMDISISVLGYWWWWLFVIPSLRSRRPKGFEKNALDIAFITSPVVSLVAPILTKDTEYIWYANCVVVVGAYVYAYIAEQQQQNDDSISVTNNDDIHEQQQQQQPEWLKFIYKSLDFGSGRERGARK
jgi:hypothetical protein